MFHVEHTPSDENCQLVTKTGSGWILAHELIERKIVLDSRYTLMYNCEMPIAEEKLQPFECPSGVSHGALILAYRRFVGMTMTEFALFVGVPRTSIWRVENGRSCIGPRWARQFEERTGVPARYWLGVSGE